MLLYLTENEVKPSLSGKPSKVKFPHIFMVLRRFAIQKYRYVTCCTLTRNIQCFMSTCLQVKSTNYT